MKTSCSKRFTLIELLVVIAIIGILAGLIFPALGSVRNNARKSKASNECQSLKTAIVMYESEFSCWPVDQKNPPTSDGLVTDYKGMCAALTGDNAKKMVFYEVGVGYDKDKGFLDPWGKPYNVAIDFDYNNKLLSSSKLPVIKAVNTANNRKDQDLPVRVAVYSFGDYNETDVEKLASKKKIVTSW